MIISVFELSGHRYALPLEATVECLRMMAFTPLPRAPAVVEGVIDLRGRAVAVLDVRARFGHAPRDPDPSEHLLVARARGRHVAMRVDRVLGVAKVREADVESAANVTPRAEYLAGIARLPDGLVMLHDLDTFLDDAESRHLDDALGARAVQGADG